MRFVVEFFIVSVLTGAFVGLINRSISANEGGDIRGSY